MTLKDIWEKTSGWLKSQVLSRRQEQPQVNVDTEGLIAQEQEGSPGTSDQGGPAAEKGDKIEVRAIQPTEKRESIEKLQEGFNKLIGQLQGINEHLNRQITQHEELMGRIEQLPQLLESFPAMVENQKQITEQMLEQLKTAAAKNEQFIDTVAKIPNETAKQTDALVNIDHQLAAAADIDVQMSESFNKFNETLDKLNQSAVGQTDSIMQMSRTFATSDRYLKYILSRQNKRFIWVFIIAVGVCVVAIGVLTAVVIYLRHTL